MKKNIIQKLILPVIICLLSVPAFSTIVLPEIFSDHMVLQQQTEAPIWGKATPKKNVRLITSWDKQTYTTLSDLNGNWTIKVKTPVAGGPYSISISDGKELILNDILIGEVWICSGQSNMEMPFSSDWGGEVLNHKDEIASANFPNIRLLHIRKTTSVKPETDVKTQSNGWQVCSPVTVPNFSTVGYFFGRELFTKLNIPIGLINTSWGGTIAEAWTSSESLELIPDFRDALQAIKSDNPATPQRQNNPNRTTVLFNAMINPLVPYAFQGAIWYQGESNANRAYQYRDLFPLMIHDWRKNWDRDFPFYFVQLASYMKKDPDPQESLWAELREAQFRTLRLKNTGMAVSIDIGDADDIHPKNKQDVGKRLAYIAEANTYNLPVVFSGPLYDNYTIEGNKIRIKFKHTDNGLKTNDGKDLTGFSIAGPDHKFIWATAVIEGNDVIVSSPDVEFPVAVRYGWANNPDCNLFNGANLPASPFRTDDWRRQENQWKQLFNGKDLSGWQVVCTTKDTEKTFWKVEEGAIVCNSIGRKDHDYVWLITDQEFEDFEIRLKFQAFSNSSGNSGLQFRSRFDKADGKGWLNGPQVDIHPPKETNWRTGLIYDETRGEQRWIFPSLKDSNIPNEYAPAEHIMKYAEDGWNELTLICKGMQIKTIVNGIVRTDWNASGILNNETHRKHNVGQKGKFALQLHSGDELHIKFKDIEILEAGKDN